MLNDKSTFNIMKKMDTVYTENIAAGYTLIEVLIALAILMSVLIPLSGAFYRNTSAMKSMQTMTAMCIVEQEQKLASVFPEDVIPLKRRNIDSKEWIVRTETSGKDPVVYRMSVSSLGVDSVTVIFYGRPSQQ
jgi:hypothetical protein